MIVFQLTPGWRLNIEDEFLWADSEEPQTAGSLEYSMSINLTFFIEWWEILDGNMLLNINGERYPPAPSGCWNNQFHQFP